MSVVHENGRPILRSRPGEQTIGAIEVSPSTLDWLIELVPDTDLFLDDLKELREACREKLWQREGGRL